jgi:hypothetical protein
MFNHIDSGEDYRTIQTPAIKRAPMYAIQRRSEAERINDQDEKSPPILLGDRLKTTLLALGIKHRNGRKLHVKSDDPRGVSLDHLTSQIDPHNVSGCIGTPGNAYEIVNLAQGRVRLAVSSELFDDVVWLSVRPLVASTATLIISRSTLNDCINPGLLNSEADPYYGKIGLLDEQFNDFNRLVESVRQKVNTRLFYLIR